MINWNTIPMTYNDSFTYLEMLGKCVNACNELDHKVDTIDIDAEQININKEDIAALKGDVDALEDIVSQNTLDIDSLEEAVANVYTKTECDNKFATQTSLANYYTKQQVNDRFVGTQEFETIIYPIQSDINALKANVNNHKAPEYADNLTTASSTASSITYTLPDKCKSADCIMVKTKATITSTDYESFSICANITIDNSSNLIGFNYPVMATLAGTTTGNLLAINVKGTKTSDSITISIGTLLTGMSVTFADTSIVAFFSATEPTPTELHEMYQQADANQDGQITLEDALLIQRFSGGIISQTYTNDLSGWTDFLADNEITQQNPVFPDANRNGTVDIGDALLVNQYVAHVTAQDFTDTEENWYLFSSGQI